MAHQHLHLQDDINSDHTHGKQVRVSLALIGTLAGGMLLFTSFVARSRFLYGSDSFQTQFLVMIAAILLGVPIVLHALKSLMSKEMHMDELVALAIIAAFATGKYFEAGIVAGFMLLSELIETRTALGARASIESLIKLTPTRANLIDSAGHEKEVKVSSLKTGDCVRVRPGDNIPADGEVAKGLSSVNEATITGESLPVDKVP
ncbi:MAG TPA: cation-translocating P-type ATPase, partial [Phycisphaerales bacterium]|nr:cation-translocating P-type ATPase [Phycisphaerales bacterium]